MNITLIGCGVYSMSIAKLLSYNTHNHLKMWVHDENLIPTLKKNLNISYTNSFKDALINADIVFLLISSSFYEQTIDNLKDDIDDKTIIYIGTKGMVKNNFLLSYTKKELSNQIYFFSGPTIASDINKAKKAFFSLSSDDMGIFNNLFLNRAIVDIASSELNLQFMSIYKNIIALASGIIWQLTNSYSTVISFLVKALQESLKVTKEKSFSYGELGDYFLTASSSKSRNYTYGTLLVKNSKEAKTFLEKNTVEGWQMFNNLKEYLQLHNYELIIINLLDEVLNKQKKPDIILSYLEK